jgi:hypothetical protein
MQHSEQELIAGYYKYQETRADADFWAWEEVDSLCHRLDTGLNIVHRLIESAPSDFSLDCIAAGHLEDLVYRFPVPAVPAIAKIAESSERMRRALLSVNVDDDSPALDAWNALLRKHHGDAAAL